MTWTLNDEIYIRYTKCMFLQYLLQCNLGLLVIGARCPLPREVMVDVDPKCSRSDPIRSVG